MDSVDAIITAFGGVTALARVIGTTPQAVSNMRARGSIPPEYWPALVAEAERKGAVLSNVTLEKLAAFAASKRGVAA